MASEMKIICERCHARLDSRGEAYICSFECTFCPECVQDLDNTCPNCGGELVRRPKQKKAAETIADLCNALLEPESIPAQCPVAGKL